MSQFEYGPQKKEVVFNIPVVADPLEVDYWVDAVIGDDSNSGKKRYDAFATIMKAHTVMTPGEVCIVRTGTYKEAVIINKNNLTFKNYPGERPIIDASQEITGWSKTGGFNYVYEAAYTEVPALGTVWEDSIWPAYDYLVEGSIAWVDTESARVWYDDVEGKIYVRTKNDDNPSDHTILASRTDIEICIKIDPAGGLNDGCYGNHVEGFQLQYATRGFWVAHTSYDNTFKDIICLYCGDMGFEFEDYSYACVAENIVVRYVKHGFTYATGAGIKLECAQGVKTGQTASRLHEVTDVLIEYVDGHGFMIFSGADEAVTATRVTIKYADRNGFEIYEDVAGVTLIDPVAGECGENGFHIHDIRNATLIRPVSYGNAQKGMSVHTVDYVTIRRPTIYDNADDGIEGYGQGGAQYVEVVSAICVGNGHHGLRASSGSQIIFWYDNSWNNGWDDYNGEYTDRGFNISVDPLFLSTDPVDPDFLYIDENSPCYKKGRDWESMGARVKE